MSYDTVTPMYHFERLSARNITDLDKLYTAVYAKHQPAGYYIKKYNTAYTHAEYIGYIAYTNNHEPAAYYGVIPCFIKYNNRMILAAQSADTMTHPAHRLKGLFMQLAKLTFKLCTQEGIKLVFGFPNQNSLQGFINLNWETTEVMELYVIPVETIAFESIAKRVPLLHKLYKLYQRRALQKYLVPKNGIESSVLADGFAGIHRDENYLDNKTCHDTQVIQVGRSLLWIKVNSNFVIGDIICPERDFNGTMNKVMRLASKMGLKQVQFQTSPDTRASRMFSKKYHFIHSYNVMFKHLGTHIHPEKIKFTFADVDVF